MLTRSKDNILIYLLFWVIYAPLVLLRWNSSQGNLIEISLILLLGLGIVLSGLFIRDYLKSRLRRTYYEPEEECEEDPRKPSCSFENVFKTDFGKVEIDLD